MSVYVNEQLPLKVENILIIDQPKDAKEVLFLLSKLLEKNGDVKPSFFDAAWQREQSMPTGLELEGGIHAAIPHTDIEHVIRPSIALAILGQPVVFKSMIEPEKDIHVRIVFLLAMNQPKKQVEILQEVATILQDKELIQKLSACSFPKEVIEIFSNDN